MYHPNSSSRLKSTCIKIHETEPLGIKFRVFLLRTWPASMGPCEPPNAWFSASAVGSKLFFSKLLTYKRAYLGVKITIMGEPPDTIFPIFP